MNDGKYASACSCFPYVRRMGFHHPRCDRADRSTSKAKMGETEITVKPHMVERVVPSYWHVFEERRMPERTVTERGEGFVAEWPAERLRSWGRTRAGAVSMLETMLSARRV